MFTAKETDRAPQVDVLRRLIPSLLLEISDLATENSRLRCMLNIPLSSLVPLQKLLYMSEDALNSRICFSAYAGVSGAFRPANRNGHNLAPTTPSWAPQPASVTYCASAAPMVPGENGAADRG